MSPGRGTHDADSIWVDPPGRRFCPDRSEGAGSILEHCWVSVALGAEAIFQDEGCNSRFIEPFRVVVSFVLGQTTVTSSRADNDGCFEGLLGVWKIGGECGAIGLLLPQRSGGSFWPQIEGGRRLCVNQAREHEADEQEEREAKLFHNELGLRHVASSLCHFDPRTQVNFPMEKESILLR